MQLCELAAQGNTPFPAEGRRQIAQRRAQLVRGLVEDHRALLCAQGIRCWARFFFVVDRKPSNVKRPVGRPDMLSAVMAAQGPGMALTVTPAPAHRRTRSSPGSEMAGEPASDTSAHVSPARMRSTMARAACRLCCAHNS